MNFSTVLVMAAGWLFLSADAGSGDSRLLRKTPAQKLAASEKSETTARGKLNDAEYKIGPQDVLRIDVWKEAEVSRAVPVRPDGKFLCLFEAMCKPLPDAACSSQRSSLMA